MFRTEFEFTLPCGYVDDEGSLHRDGVMRRATAADEILPLRDPRVAKNPAYLAVILLSRVVTRLGSLEQVNPRVIENLFASDFAYLQDRYNEWNHLDGTASTPAVCPQCQHEFKAEVASLGSDGLPLDALHEEVAFISYHFHWPLADVMTMEHADRREWVNRISGINQEMNQHDAATH